MGEFRIETDRLVLREWRDADSHAMYRIGQDTRVMEFLGPLTSRDDARALVAGQIVNQSLFGHCFWAIERRSDAILLGYCGLNSGPKDTPLDGGIEIGWQLAHNAWGQGYAREAAAASLAWGWAMLDVPSIAAITIAANTRSRGLMERLGMKRSSNEDFEHPTLAPHDPMRPHIVYRIERPTPA